MYIWKQKLVGHISPANFSLYEKKQGYLISHGKKIGREKSVLTNPYYLPLAPSWPWGPGGVMVYQTGVGSPRRNGLNWRPWKIWKLSRKVASLHRTLSRCGDEWWMKGVDTWGWRWEVRIDLEGIHVRIEDCIQRGSVGWHYDVMEWWWWDHWIIDGWLYQCQKIPNEGPLSVNLDWSWSWHVPDSKTCLIAV